MLDPVYEYWFGIFQSVGAIATAIALFFVALQTHYTRKQASSMQQEITTRLRPWIYRMSSKDQAFEFMNGRVIIYFNNMGQVAAHHISMYYIFRKDAPDEAMTKRDVEETLLREKPIVREKLIIPYENTHLDMPMDQSVQRTFEDGFAIFLHILVRYRFSGGDDEREGGYLGPFTMQKLGTTGYNADLVREWAT